MPVVVDGKVVASFSLDCTAKPRAFYPDEVELCRSLADQLTVAFKKAKLYQEAHDSQKRIQALYDASNVILASHDPEVVLRSVMETARHIMGAWFAVLLLVDESQSQLRTLEVSGFERPLDRNESIRPNGISWHVIRSVQAQFIPDTDAEADRVHPNMLRDGIKAAACLPLCLAGRIVGVLWLHFREKRQFSNTEKRALELYANQSAIAYDNAYKLQQLERMRQAAAAMVSPNDVNDVLKTTAASTRLVVGADYAFILPYDDSKDEFVADGLITDNTPLGATFPPFTGNTSRRILREGYLSVSDLKEQAPFLAEVTRNFLTTLEVQSFQGIRLGQADESLGVLIVDYKTLRAFGSEDRSALEAVAAFATAVLKKARLLDRMSRLRQAARRIAQVSTLGDLGRALQSIVAGAQETLRSDIATI